MQSRSGRLVAAVCGLAIVAVFGLFGIAGPAAGQTDDDQTDDVAAPADPVAPADAPDFVEISAGAEHSCGVSAASEVYCWGSNRFGRLGIGSQVLTVGQPELLPALTGVVSVSVGANSCATTASAELYCWGQVVGDGTDDTFRSPVPIDLPPVSSVSLGYGVSCVVVDGGEVHCWGRRFSPSVFTPTKVEGLPPVVEVSTYQSSCAVTEDAEVWCWDGPNGVAPAKVDGLPPIRTVEKGQFHTCAVAVDGAPFCWGLNWEGQLGDGNSNNERTEPAPVLGVTNVVSMSLGAGHSCASTENGDTYCWGRNSWGILGNGTIGSFNPTPGLVLGDEDFVQLSAGAEHTCGLAADGDGSCWGAGRNGKLGDGTYLDRSAPTPILVPTASIGGRAATPGNVGVAGVEVDLYNDSRSRFLLKATTDANGDYRFDVQADCYNLTFIAPEGSIIPATDTRYQDRFVCVGDGEENLSTNVTISTDGLTGSLGGSALDAGGRPVEGLLVDLFEADAAGVRGGYLRTVASDATGVYSFAVAPGCYSLVAIAPINQTFVNGSQWFERSLCVEADEARIDLDVMLAGSVADATILGDVSEQDGTAVVGVVVDLFVADATGERASYVRSVTTSNDGVFTIEGPAGCYVIVAIAPDGRTFTNGTGYFQQAVCVDAGETSAPISAVLG